jgi:triacylglycerol lipase
MLRTRTIVAATAAALLLAAGAACTTTPASGQVSGKTPVVLVHGYIEGTSIWGPMQNALKAAGYKSGDITNFGYDTTGAGAKSSAQTAAGELAKSVDAALAYAKSHGNPGATKVDIVSHSYGGMISRYCISVGGCAGKVAHWMSLAGADGGTSLGSVPALLGEGSGDMAPNSAVVQLLKRADTVQSVLAQGIKIEVQWTSSDGVIIPAANSQWPSPQNPDPAANKQIDGLNHMSILSNAPVLAETIRFFGS